MPILYQVDAFTRTPFTGNPAGVVLESDRLSDSEMQSIAAELKNSETAFLLKPDGADHDVRARFFTPSTEVPTCGHATIAAHYARALEFGVHVHKVVQKTGAGILQPIEVGPYRGGTGIWMDQGAAKTEPALDAPLRDRLLAALGLTRDSLVDGWSPQIVSTGHSKVIARLRSRQLVDSVEPDLAALTQLSHDIGCNGYFIFTTDTGDSGFLTYSRMFAPAIGIAEDPVTGNGHGPLGAYLAMHGLLEFHADTANFRGIQGVRMRRPGEVGVDVRRVDAGFSVRIVGEAVAVFRGVLNVSSHPKAPRVDGRSYREDVAR